MRSGLLTWIRLCVSTRRQIWGIEITLFMEYMVMRTALKIFFSPEWVDLFLYTLQEAKQLGLELIWLMLPGWPFEDLGLPRRCVQDGGL